MRSLLFLSLFGVVYGKRYLVETENERTDNLEYSKIEKIKKNLYMIETCRNKNEIKAIEEVINVEEDNVLKFLPIEEVTTASENYQWGLDRVDQQFLPLDKEEYQYPLYSNVRVYVLDTGIRVNHTEFENRAIPGVNTISDDQSTDDIHSHGTHVASTIAGANVGVANVTVVAVKVLDDNGRGHSSSVIKGMEWVVKDIKDNNYCGIISMSLGGGKNEMFNEAVNSVVRRGVNVVVAAGNNNNDSCQISPASAELAITVGSSDIDDSRSYYSNYGSCNDLYAPGRSILGADNRNVNGYRTKSGTSMATPHVTGALALYLNQFQCSGNVTEFLLSSQKGVINDTKDEKSNRLVQSNFVTPTKSPTVITNFPTKSPTVLLGRGFKRIIWKKDISFTMNNPYGKIIFRGVTLGPHERSRRITMKNYMVTPNSIVEMNLNGFSQGISIPYVFVNNVKDGELIFAIANIHDSDIIDNAYFVINYSIKN